MANFLVRSAIGVLLMLHPACTPTQGLIKPEVLDVTSHCSVLKIDAINQYGTDKVSAPSNLVFCFTNCSMTDTLRVEVGMMKLIDMDSVLTISSNCKSLQLLPLEMKQCRIFWTSALLDYRYLSPGAVFLIPVYCVNQADTVRCVLR